MNATDLKVHLRQQFNASPEMLFDAWLKPEIMKRWIFASDTNEIFQVKIDPKPGGKFSILERNDGETIDHFGKYKEIDRPNRLVFSLEVPWHFSGVTVVTVLIHANGNGSELDFTQTGVSPEKTEASWRDMFRRLNNLLDEKRR